MNTNSVHLRFSAWDVLAFGLEIAAVVAAGAWGQRVAGWPGLTLAALALIVLWGTFLSPKAPRPITGIAWPLTKLAVLSLSALVVLPTFGPVPAAILLALALLNVLQGGTR
ncbi:DUF2568 domain-containing protein [Deinococcus frigens]|uniref:DUF2568 domain-containing protein n=1 Tax=Deinococcus frigens TaxID=249403 RepID=UPI00049534C0|nr:DUF2568 domain-containing protein [Deinococcus frigens]